MQEVFIKLQLYARYYDNHWERCVNYNNIPDIM